jgi:hypothetical protein
MEMNEDQALVRDLVTYLDTSGELHSLAVELAETRAAMLSYKSMNETIGD